MLFPIPVKSHISMNALIHNKGLCHIPRVNNSIYLCASIITLFHYQLYGDGAMYCDATISPSCGTIAPRSSCDLTVTVSWNTEVQFVVCMYVNYIVCLLQ